MGRITRHFTLPISSAEFASDPTFVVHGKSAWIKFDYFVEQSVRHSAIEFIGVIATRTYTERTSSARHVKPLDTLTEIHQVEWLNEIKGGIAERHHATLEGHRHFMIYLDSAGCFEVLSKDYSIVPEQTGSWENQALSYRR